jgi:hypothetical protein
MIKFKMGQSGTALTGTALITQVTLPHIYFDHFHATSIYRDLADVLHHDFVLSDGEYGF